MPDHEVAIVGAGPVGLLLACLLGQAGVDVVVSDRRSGRDERSRAIGIHPPGQAALDAAGLGPRARAEALHLEGGEVICDGRILASLSFTERHRVLILPQHRTHALLFERLRELPSVALLTSHDVVEVRNEGESARVVMRVDGERQETTASFVVAADGVHSGVRQQLGIAWLRRPGSGSYAMVDVPEAQGGDQRARLHCERTGLVEVFPFPDGRRRWVAADPQRLLDDADAFVRAVKARTGVRLDLSPGITPTTFEVQQHRAERLTAGRIVLLGDAAHETSPIGGQGMNLGWVAAHRLSVTLTRSLRGGRVDLREYECLTRRAAAGAQRRSAFYMAMGRPADGAALTARNAVIRLLGASPLRTRTADLITMQGMMKRVPTS